VFSWITNALAKDLQDNAAHVQTAREIWKYLEERFTQGIEPRVYELKRAIALLQQEKSSISSYYGLNPIPVCNCGSTCGAASSMREVEKVFDFLMGLDEAYMTVRSQILSIDPLSNLGRAYAIAAQEEKRRVVTSYRAPTIDVAALMIREDES
ncbi:hypothetical protein RJ639_024570, partial [Escallonia herrerae]